MIEDKVVADISDKFLSSSNQIYSKEKNAQNKRGRKESVTEELYYVEKRGFLGNALLWWTKGCNVYLRYKWCLSLRENKQKKTWTQDSAYLCTYIDGLEKAKKVIIDSQYVDKSEKIMELKSMIDLFSI
jgi:hypothetical protein